MSQATLWWKVSSLTSLSKLCSQMQISIKSLKGETFDVQVDPANTVLSLKQQIEQLKGHTASLQKLIHAGNILEDGKPIAEYNLPEGTTVVLMMTKPKPAPRGPPPPAEPVQPVPRAAPQPAGASAPIGSGPPAGPAENEAAVSQIMDMGFPREHAVAALRAANQQPEQALELLMSGFGEEDDDSGYGENPLAFLADNPSFQQIRALIRENPNMIGSLMTQLAQSNPELAQAIEENPNAFMQLIEEPDILAPGGGDAGNAIELTQEEAEAVQRLRELGFHQRDVLEAYLSCDKNEQMAANFLFENYQSIGEEYEGMGEQEEPH